MLDDKQRKQSAVTEATVPLAPTSTFKILLLVNNGAVSEQILRGTVFVFSGIFNEVYKYKGVAEEGIKKMITLPGGEVKGRFSKNTNYLLLDKSADTSKLKSANECQVEVVNMRRRQTQYDSLTG